MENVDPQLGHLLTPGTSQAISRGALKAKNARQPATPLNPSRLCEQFSNSLKLDAQTPAPYKLAGAPTPPGGATQAAFRAARKHKATPLLAKTSAAIIPSTTVTAPAGESSDDRLSPLERLPQLVLRLVFARLSPRDLCSLSVASKACHQLVDDNETWRPHVNALRARYGVNVPAGDSDSLMALYCNIKNSERLYGARRAQQVPQATQDVLDNFTIFSSVCLRSMSTALMVISRRSRSRSRVSGAHRAWTLLFCSLRLPHSVGFRCDRTFRAHGTAQFATCFARALAPVRSLPTTSCHCAAST